MPTRGAVAKASRLQVSSRTRQYLQVPSAIVGDGIDVLRASLEGLTLVQIATHEEPNTVAMLHALRRKERGLSPRRQRVQHALEGAWCAIARL
eukprot:scaffold2776_cov365-Prasinococcus_capsulatus_cf.AAC.2